MSVYVICKGLIQCDQADMFSQYHQIKCFQSYQQGIHNQELQLAAVKAENKVMREMLKLSLEDRPAASRGEGVKQ